MYFFWKNCFYICNKKQAYCEKSFNLLNASQEKCTSIKSLKFLIFNLLKFFFLLVSTDATTFTYVQFEESHLLSSEIIITIHTSGLTMLVAFSLWCLCCLIKTEKVVGTPLHQSRLVLSYPLSSRCAFGSRVWSSTTPQLCAWSLYINDFFKRTTGRDSK